MRSLKALALALATLPLVALAQDVETIALDTWLAQLFEAVAKLGGLSTMAIISAALTIVVSSMKVSFLRQLVWDRLGPLKVFVAPLLGLVAGILSLKADGSFPPAGTILAYVFAGAGAVFLHQLFDAIKAVPGLGAAWVKVIEWVSKVLGAKAAPIALLAAAAAYAGSGRAIEIAADGVGGVDVTLSTAEAEHITGDGLAAALMQAASEQVFDKDGDPVGFQLTEIDAGSPYELAGLRDGDVVSEIEGVALTTPELAVGLLRSIRGEPAFTYTVLRPKARCWDVAACDYSKIRYSVRVRG